MKDKKILIIGGAGFLGQSLLKTFMKENVFVFYAGINPIPGLEQNFISLDILKQSDFRKIKVEFNMVINLTGQITNPSNLCLELNTNGIQNIIKYVLMNKINLIHVSSLSVYGSSNEEINEESKLNPETAYGSLKITSEYLIQDKLPHNQYLIIRLSNLYGESQKKGIISYLLKSIKKNENIYFNNDGFLKRYFLNVKDASSLIYEMVNNYKSGIYNYPGNDIFSIKELILLIEKIGNKTLNVIYENNKPWENLKRINSSKIDSHFCYRSEYTLEDWLVRQFNMS